MIAASTQGPSEHALNRFPNADWHTSPQSKQSGGDLTNVTNPFIIESIVLPSWRCRTFEPQFRSPRLAV
jgi:hypothetical protein